MKKFWISRDEMIKMDISLYVYFENAEWCTVVY